MSLRTNIEDRLCSLSTNIADKFGSPAAIVAFPILCAAWLLIIGQVDALTLVLSIVSITLTQMVLQSQSQETELSKIQMAELIRAIPEARDELAKTDKTTAADVRALKERV